MKPKGYDLADEPDRNRFNQWTVRPVFCLLAVMLGGAWLAWPWYAFNSIALGSPTRRKELLWVAGGLLGTCALAVSIVWAMESGRMSVEMLRYAIILISVVKLVAMYAIVSLQTRTFHVYEYYGGAIRNGVPLLILGALARSWILEAFEEIPFLIMVLS